MKRSSARGFTLIEVVIAVAITAGIGVTVGAAFNQAIAARDMAQQESEHYRMLRAAMNRMTREIGGAFVSDHYDAKRYRDQYDRPTNFVGKRESLLFSTMTHQRLYADAKESDQMVVEYSIKSSPDPKARGRQDLVRREKPLIDERMDRGGQEEVLYEGAKKIEFQYWDSEKKQWDDEWDTRQRDRKSMLPTRVRVVLTAKDETGKEARYTTQARIVMNVEIPRYQ
jgi:general secretion pathway protein J